MPFALLCHQDLDRPGRAMSLWGGVWLISALGAHGVHCDGSIKAPTDCVWIDAPLKQSKNQPCHDSPRRGSSPTPQGLLPLPRGVCLSSCLGGCGQTWLSLGVHPTLLQGLPTLPEMAMKWLPCGAWVPTSQAQQEHLVPFPETVLVSPWMRQTPASWREL